MAPTLDVWIAPDGEIRLQAQGFTGNQCRQATQRLIAALGTVREEKLLSEFYVTAPTTAETLQHQSPSL